MNCPQCKCPYELDTEPISMALIEDRGHCFPCLLDSCDIDHKFQIAEVEVVMADFIKDIISAKV